MRNYVEVPRDDGKVDIAFRFVFDDGGSTPALLSERSPMPELAEYARGIFSDDHFTIKVGAESLRRAEELFDEINRRAPNARALMFTETPDLSADAGYAWTSDYKLVKAAPGLMDELPS